MATHAVWDWARHCPPTHLPNRKGLPRESYYRVL
jgi:hypothetical protein